MQAIVFYYQCIAEVSHWDSSADTQYEMTWIGIG